MEEAKKIVNRTPAPSPRSESPMQLPDMTGSNIINIIEDIAVTTDGRQLLHYIDTYYTFF